ncbi:hypothetical protein BJ878DRAFT_265540 [Calycina marina]|uniref:Uncharacterized protein n=1 Tax=Calycina marina TaxID=1763456 RepID=A0A9P7ZAZ7_9HELO|nr:hypothetical protein BJ878DRAFT_265540 [Calycina marina]
MVVIARLSSLLRLFPSSCHPTMLISLRTSHPSALLSKSHLPPSTHRTSIPPPNPPHHHHHPRRPSTRSTSCDQRLN